MFNLGMPFIIAGLVALAGIVLFLILGFPLLRRLGDKVGQMFYPSGNAGRIVPEYSVAEARAQQGRWLEAVAEYRKVQARFPQDVFVHIRVAELALEHLDDRQLAETELRTACEKAANEDSLTLVTHRLADFYQYTTGEPQRAINVLESLRPQLTSAQLIQQMEDRLGLLRRLAAGETVPVLPSKIKPGKSRFDLDKDSHTQI